MIARRELAELIKLIDSLNARETSYLTLDATLYDANGVSLGRVDFDALGEGEYVFRPAADDE